MRAKVKMEVKELEVWTLFSSTAIGRSLLLIEEFLVTGRMWNQRELEVFQFLVDES